MPVGVVWKAKTGRGSLWQLCVPRRGNLKFLRPRSAIAGHRWDSSFATRDSFKRITVMRSGQSISTCCATFKHVKLTFKKSSLRAQLHVVGQLWFTSSDINEPSSPTSSFFILILCLFLFSRPFQLLHSINSPDNSLFSHSVLPVLSLPYWSFQLYISLWKSPSALM